MRLRGLFILCFFVHLLSAQTADEQIRAILNQGNYFELYRQYPVLKEELSPVMQEFCESMLGIAFNKPAKASKHLTKLINTYQADFQNQGLISLVQLLAFTHESQEKYREAADIIKSLIDQAGGQMDPTTANSSQSLYRIYSALQNESGMVINRLEKKTVVNLIYKAVGKEQKNNPRTVVYIPATINDSDEEFLFDTSSNTNIISHSLAMKHDLRIVADSIFITSALGTEWAQIAIANQLVIGNLIMKNVLFYVVQDQNLQSYGQAVIGMPLIKKLDEIQLFPKEKKMLFPERASSKPSERPNLMLVSDLPVVELQRENENLLLNLETNKPVSYLNNTYYQKNKGKYSTNQSNSSLFIEEPVKEIEMETLLLKPYTFQIYNQLISIPQMHLITQSPVPLPSTFDGTLGMDILLQFKKVTLNLKEMFIAVE